MKMSPPAVASEPPKLGEPHVDTGAGWLVPLCGAIMQMPGLGKSPAAFSVDIDAEGRTVGLF